MPARAARDLSRRCNASGMFRICTITPMRMTLRHAHHMSTQKRRNRDDLHRPRPALSDEEHAGAVPAFSRGEAGTIKEGAARVCPAGAAASKSGGPSQVSWSALECGGGKL